jgi:hypothetical protein
MEQAREAERPGREGVGRERMKRKKEKGRGQDREREEGGSRQRQREERRGVLGLVHELLCSYPIGIPLHCMQLQLILLPP